MAKDIGSYFLEQGQPIVPKAKPKQYTIAKEKSQTEEVLDILNTKAAATMLSPRTYVNLVGQTARKAYDQQDISASDYYDIVMPLFGETGEMVTEKIRQYDAELDRYADGGRVNFGDGPPGKRGGAFQDYTKRISKPSAKELKIAESVYGNTYNKKGLELWKSLTQGQRGGIRQGSTTGGSKGPKPTAPNQLGKEKFLELAKANKGKTYEEFLEVIKDYKTVRGSDFTQESVQDRVKQYGLGGGFFKRKPGKGFNKEVDERRFKKREASLEATAPFKAKGSKGFNFHHIRQIGGDVPLTTDDIAILNQRVNSSIGSKYNKKLNDIADEITKNNRLALEAMNAKEENKALKLMQKVEALNNQAEGIVKNAIKDLPSPYKKMVGFNKFSLPTNEYGLPIEKEPYVIKKVGGAERTKGAIPLADLTLEQEAALRKQIKTDSLKLEKAGLKDKILSGTGKVLKGVGKVIKPIGYMVGTKALFDAKALAKNQNIDLSLVDQIMAVDSGDPYVALDNYKRRNVPGYSEKQAGITLGKFKDDFTEVGEGLGSLKGKLDEL